MSALVVGPRRWARHDHVFVFSRGSWVLKLIRSVPGSTADGPEAPSRWTCRAWFGATLALDADLGLRLVRDAKREALARLEPLIAAHGQGTR